jgi:hypothetical protein
MQAGKELSSRKELWHRTKKRAMYSYVTLAIKKLTRFKKRMIAVNKEPGSDKEVYL